MQWIRQTDLESWADRIGSRIEFPVMIRDLILASARDVGEIRYMRFPGGESGEVRGYDGDLTTVVGSTYVPAGRSVWEFGTNEDPVDKFKKDYRKRADEAKETKEKEAETKTLTFVFVTPRNWNNQNLKLPDFLKEYQDQRIFADVRYVDGAMLETWLEQHGAVGAKHARLVLGHVPKLGARSTDEFWSDYSNEYSPQLTEAVALCARKEQAGQIVSHLMGERGSLVFVGDGPNEVSAVAVAAIRAATEADRRYLEARTLIVDSDEAGRLLSVADRYSFIVSPNVKEVGGTLAAFGPAVSTLDHRPRSSKFTRLERPSVRDMSEALRTMGFHEGKAEALARRSGRSLTVLQRHAHAAGYKRPHWRGDGARLIPALLAGAWNTRQEGDRAVLAELSGLDYDGFELGIRPYLEIQDTPIDLRAGVWMLRAPVDAFTNLSHLVLRQHLDRLASVAVKVFSTGEPPDVAQERFGVSTSPYSSLLRDGIATTLLILAAMHEEVELDAVDSPDTFVRDLVEGLPGLGDDPRVVFGLDGQLTHLMEAAPDPLLSTLEHLLEGETDITALLFAETNVLGGVRLRLPNILWALEMQAWDPDYFRRVALLLAKLAALDPGGRSGNRPINSLRDIYVAWAPGTNAPLAERLAVLDEIGELHPEVGWQLLALLLPRFQDSKGSTQRPRFRDAGASERETLTLGMVQETYDAVTDRALSVLGHDQSRWTTVAEAFPAFSPDRRTQFLQILDEYGSSVVDEDRIEFRRALRRIADRHGRFRKADWALPDAELDHLNRIVAGLESTDPLGRARALFDDRMPFGSDDHAAGDKALEQRRRAAVAGLAATGGAQAVLQLAGLVRMPRLVARSAAGIEDEEVVATLLDDGDPHAPAPDFAASLAGNLRQVRGDAFDGRIMELAAERGWSAVRTATIILQWPEDRETWRFVDSLGVDAAEHFWSKREVRRFEGSADDLRTLVLKYAVAGRASTALEVVHGREKDLDWQTAGFLLDALAREVEVRDARSDLDGFYVGELLKELRSRPEIDRLALARFEHWFFPLLEREGENLVLFELMATNPEFFVSILADVYVEDGVDPGDQEPTEAERLRANASHRILIAFDRMPGEKGGTIEEIALTSWVDGMIEQGRKARRSNVVPLYIGRVLAHASLEDDVWPPVPVAATVERLKSDDVERSIMIERFNMRGIYSKAVFEGGRQERDLAAENRKWAKARSAFPRTKAMLNAIARRWDEDAVRADDEAERDRIRFEG